MGLVNMNTDGNNLTSKPYSEIAQLRTINCKENREDRDENE
jgi:hypothetical protein